MILLSYFLYYDHYHVSDMINSNAMANFGAIYGMIKYTMEALNTIDSLTEKLEEKSVDKDEVRTLRTEFTSKVNETFA